MDSDSTIYVCTYGYEITNRKGEKSTYADTLWIDTVLPVSKIEELIQESGVAEPASHIAQQVMPFIRFFGNEEKRIEFTQKWIGDAVKKLLQKDDIYESDMERIKYMRIGDCDFGGIYTIEMSTAAPPEPFCTTDGGDEWDPDGGAHVTGRFIRLYIDYAKRESCDIDSYTGECFFQLPPYDIWKEFAEEYEEAIQEEEDEEDEDAEDWESPVKKWESFEKTILCETYREKFDDDDAYEEWERRTDRGIQQDIGLFTGLEVLRLYSAEYQDMTFLRAMPLLRVLEVVETRFVALEGIDDLARLKQLCCWFA